MPPAGSVIDDKRIAALVERIPLLVTVAIILFALLFH